ncbi:MAG: flagellar hook-basal body complex protein, partial [Acidibacillus sp.]|nr:flagellar hook-basal body complex protein [Acidibacillus sp.]
MPIALDSATSGMNAFQQMMDVIGNNIANVNTTGYKSSSTTFEDLLSQTMSGGSAGNGSNGIGGTNPVQVGLGTQVASITSNFAEGSLQNTGNPNDLAINGTGFFVVSPSTTGGQLYYTRAGDFHVDSNGY